MLERFSVECQKKQSDSSNRSGTDANNQMNQSELKVNACSRHKARKNACRQVAIGFVSFLIG